MAEEGKNMKEIGFTVDAGLIDRLGRELVGRAETAVSELVKNSYDADATEVKVTFIDSDIIGGSLVIEDNGVGMNEFQLEQGFMRISSTDKVHHPVSEKYGRTKAGKKGIGRFATQRLGSRLTIISQTKESDSAIRIVIKWDKYKIDQDITSISFPLEFIEKQKDEGTVLRIDGLKDVWSEPAIKRIFRYVSELLQPNYLSEKGRESNTATQEEQTFNVVFYRTIGNYTETVASEQKMIFDKALATIDGIVDDNGFATVKVFSEALSLNDVIPICPDDGKKHFDLIKNVHFRVYYFIYNRHDYYKGRISSLELKNVQTIAENASGVRLYRNGFRVLPYGEPLDDWLALDKRWNVQSGVNAPLGNKNFFGFVEIIDPQGVQYEETASREGLIDNNSFVQLKAYLHLALRGVQLRMASALEEPKKERDEKFKQKKKRSASEIIKDIKDKMGQDSSSENVDEDFNELEDVIQTTIGENNMLRVLAAMGLTIGEFTHEVIQFTPDINGYISSLLEQKELSQVSKQLVENLGFDIRNFLAYTAYFNAIISENVSRETKPVSIRVVVSDFMKIIQRNLDKIGIKSEKPQFYGYDLYTAPMHISEWISILYNLYTNAKKAIKRAKVEGRINIVGGEENGMIYLEFSDNGDGIPEENKEKIFAPFFTTSTPAGFSAPSDEQLLGTGLGLKIVKDIVESHKGNISVIEPETSYATCFRIEIPKATKEELNAHGI